jgi:ankyrin repeat protein
MQILIFIFFFLNCLLAPNKSNAMDNNCKNQELTEKFSVYLKSDDLHGVEYCLSQGLNLDQVFINLDTSLAQVEDDPPITCIPALLHAFLFNSLETCHFLLKHGADPNISDSQEGFTPLCFLTLAVKDLNFSLSKYMQRARLLLQYGANPDSSTAHQEDALYYAAQANLLPAVRLLLAHGAQLHTYPYSTPPLIGAAINKSLVLAQLLVTYNADTNIRGNVARIVQSNSTIEDKAESFPLLIATADNHLEMVKFLLTYEANANETDPEGCLAYSFAKQDSALRALLFALATLPDPNPLLRSIVKYPLAIAAFKGDEAQVKELLASKHVASQPLGAFTPLHWAAAQGRTKILPLLLDHNPELINHQFQDITPLDLAVLNGHATCAEILMRQGGGFSLYNPLWWAIHKKCSQDTYDLLEIKESKQLANTQDKYGNTPVHKAAIQPKTPFLKLLIQKGADLTIKNKVGVTPLELLSANQDPNDIGYLGERVLGPLLAVLSKSDNFAVKVVGGMPELMYYLGGFLAQAHYQAPSIEQKLPIKKVLLLDTYAALKATSSLPKN